MSLIRSMLGRPLGAVARTATHIATKYGGVPVSMLRLWNQAYQDNEMGDGGYHHPYARDPDIFRAITIISDSAASVPLRIGKRSAAGGRVKPIEEGLEYETLRRPSRRTSTPDLISQIAGYLQCHHGQAIVIITGQELSVRNLTCVNPEWVRIELASDGTYEYWMTGRDGTPRMFPESQVIDFRRAFNPYNPDRSVGPLSAARFAYEESADIGRHNRALVRNGGIKPLLVSTEHPLPDKPELKRAKAELNADRKALDKRGEVMFLGWGMKWQDVSMTPQDMDFSGQRLNSKMDKATCFGVPPSKMGDYQRDQADAEVQERDFWNDTMKPLLRIIAATFERDMWKITGRANPVDANWFVWFDTSQVPALVLQEHKIRESDRGDIEIGLTTINRVLEKRGEEPLPWGDIPPQLWMLVGIPGLLEPIGPIGAGAGDDDPNDDGGGGKRASDIVKTLRSADDVRWLAFMAAGAPLEQSFTRGLVSVWDFVERDVRRAIRDAARTSTLDVIAGRRRTLFGDDDDEGNGNGNGHASGMIVKDRIRVKAEELVLPIDQIAARLRGFSRPIMRAGQRQGAVRGVNLAKRPASKLRLDAKPAVDQLLKQEQRFAVPVARTTWKRLVGGLGEVLQEGGSEKDLTDVVMQVMNVRRYEAARTARTEVSAAMNGGVDVGFLQSGVVKTKTWLTAGDEHVRESHQAANGQEVPVGQMFHVGAADLAFPGDPTGPGEEVIECRCTEVPGELV